MNSESIQKIDLKSFVVVNFDTDDSVEVVPATWISEDQSACPFPTTIPRNFGRLQIDPNSTPDSDWPVWGVTCVKGYSKLN